MATCHFLLDPINLVTCIYRLARMYSGIRSHDLRAIWKAELMANNTFQLLLRRCYVGEGLWQLLSVLTLAVTAPCLVGPLHPQVPECLHTVFMSEAPTSSPPFRRSQVPCSPTCSRPSST